MSFPRKRESSNYTQLWIPDQVGNDKTREIRTFYESIKFQVKGLSIINCLVQRVEALSLPRTGR